jgi:hypothetical protein
MKKKAEFFLWLYEIIIPHFLLRKGDVSFSGTLEPGLKSLELTLYLNMIISNYSRHYFEL